MFFSLLLAHDSIACLSEANHIIITYLEAIPKASELARDLIDTFTLEFQEEDFLYDRGQRIAEQGDRNEKMGILFEQERFNVVTSIETPQVSLMYFTRHTRSWVRGPGSE